MGYFNNLTLGDTDDGGAADEGWSIDDRRPAYRSTPPAGSCPQCGGDHALSRCPHICRMDVLGVRWTICGAPSDGPCMCGVMVRATPPISQTLTQLQAVRDQLDLADRDPLGPRQIGRILVALGVLTDIVERIAIEADPPAATEAR